ELWTSLSGKIHDYLASVTLAHLVAQQRGAGVAEIQDNTRPGSRRRAPSPVSSPEGCPHPNPLPKGEGAMVKGA
ncbi:MAG: hypothetical protein Q8J61_01915, partial [Sulfuricella sp.]|nr:hypothetical protein [Sulfuricella sp.]